MSSKPIERFFHSSMLLLVLFCSLTFFATVTGRAHDICNQKPTINGLCVSSTLGIYFDSETQHCKYMGCSPDRKLFATLEDCEKICNNSRHRRRRIQNENYD